MILYLIIRNIQKNLLLIYLLTLVAFVIYIAVRAHHIHGVLTRCDPKIICDDFSKRNQTSLEFLCCEDSNGWPVAHSTNPGGAYVFFKNKFIVVLLITFNEIIECALRTFFNSFVIFPSKDRDLETTSGILLADMYIQGMTQNATLLPMVI